MAGTGRVNHSDNGHHNMEETVAVVVTVLLQPNRFNVPVKKCIKEGRMQNYHLIKLAKATVCSRGKERGASSAWTLFSSYQQWNPVATN